MYLDFSSLFHQSSKDRSGQGRVRIPLDPADYPPEWKSIQYKTYNRFEKKPLPRAQETDMSLFESIGERQSRRDFSGMPVSSAHLSTLLRYGCGVTKDERGKYHRAQPSGGARYPIEAYAFVFIPTDDIPAGAYHYDVRQHALDALWQRDFSEKDIAELFTYPWAQQAALGITLTGVFWRNQMKYGERGYRQILIEAGAIVQNVYLAATALGLQCTAIDGVRELNIEKILDVDGFSESVICSMVLGG